MTLSGRLIGLLVVTNCFGNALAVPAPTTQQSCRCFPGDPEWPSEAEWDAFNSTLGGKLILNTPIASVCHDSEYGPYMSEACRQLQDNWFLPETHYVTSSSIMAAWFTNNSCNPFLDRSAPCTIGNYNLYAVNATDVADYQATIAFIKKHNIRLTIRNTGHDYDGKSSGAGAVSIWTHNMKDMQILDYKSPHYTGKAMKMGAGVQVIDMYQAAHDAGLIMVGGDCPSVGVAGGYSQGAGHGPLASRYGLAADQVLEWEVVTGAGELLTATPTENADLYWALCGGGGGTYGIVSSLTSKAYPDTYTSAANLTFSVPSLSSTDLDTFYDAFGFFQSQLPPMVDGGVSLIYVITNSSFTLAPATAPGVTQAELDFYFKPTLDMLVANNITHSYYSQQNPTFLESYQQMTLIYPWDIGQLQLGGRMVPRTLVEQDNTALTGAIRDLMAVDPLNEISGFAINVNWSNTPDAIGANPYWREMIIDVVMGT